MSSEETKKIEEDKVVLPKTIEEVIPTLNLKGEVSPETLEAFRKAWDKAVEGKKKEWGEQTKGMTEQEKIDFYKEKMEVDSFFVSCPSVDSLADSFINCDIEPGFDVETLSPQERLEKSERLDKAVALWRAAKVGTIQSVWDLSDEELDKTFQEVVEKQREFVQVNRRDKEMLDQIWTPDGCPLPGTLVTLFQKFQIELTTEEENELYRLNPEERAEKKNRLELVLRAAQNAKEYANDVWRWDDKKLASYRYGNPEIAIPQLGDEARELARQHLTDRKRRHPKKKLEKPKQTGRGGRVHQVDESGNVVVSPEPGAVSEEWKERDAKFEDAKKNSGRTTDGRFPGVAQSVRWVLNPFGLGTKTSQCMNVPWEKVTILSPKELATVVMCLRQMSVDSLKAWWTNKDLSFPLVSMPEFEDGEMRRSVEYVQPQEIPQVGMDATITGYGDAASLLKQVLLKPDGARRLAKTIESVLQKNAELEQRIEAIGVPLHMKLYEVFKDYGTRMVSEQRGKISGALSSLFDAVLRVVNPS